MTKTTKKATKKTSKAKKPIVRSTAAKSRLAAAAVRGCCTLIGEGPDEQHEGLTREECRLLAIKEDRNFQWVAGQCAQPS